jgi:hypothetical protein
MVDLRKILDAGKELEKLSREAAERAGYKSGGFGDDTGGSFYEIVTAGKFEVRRGSSDSGPRSTPSDYGPDLRIDGTTIDMWALDEKNRKALEQKLAKAFKPLMEAFEFEKLEAPYKAAAAQKAKRDKALADQREHNKKVRKLLSSLD